MRALRALAAAWISMIGSVKNDLVWSKIVWLKVWSSLLKNISARLGTASQRPYAELTRISRQRVGTYLKLASCSVRL